MFFQDFKFLIFQKSNDDMCPLPQDFDPCGCIYIYIVLLKSLYLPQGLRYRRSIFITLYHTISLCTNIFWCFAQALCRRYEVRYLMWFKTATFSSRSLPIASNLECTQRGHVAIDLFCSLIFILSITEILLWEVNAHLPGRFTPIILANRVEFNVWGNYWH